MKARKTTASPVQLKLECAHRSRILCQWNMLEYLNKIRLVSPGMLHRQHIQSETWSQAFIYIFKMKCRKNKDTNSKRYMYPNVHCNIIYSCQDREATQVSNRWLDKEDVVYIYHRVLLSHKKEWKFAIGGNVRRLGGHYAKWNKSHRGRQILYVTTCMCEI